MPFTFNRTTCLSLLFTFVAAVGFVLQKKFLSKKQRPEEESQVLFRTQERDLPRPSRSNAVVMDRLSQQDEDFSWVNLEEISPNEADGFSRTLTEEQYARMSDEQPHNPYWWTGMLGNAWRGHVSRRPDYLIRNVVEQIDAEIPKRLEDGQSIEIEGDSLRSRIRRYRAFDKVIDDKILQHKQSEVSWLEAKDYFLLFHLDDENLDEGVAIRKADGFFYKWKRK